MRTTVAHPAQTVPLGLHESCHKPAPGCGVGPGRWEWHQLCTPIRVLTECRWDAILDLKGRVSGLAFDGEDEL
jgi:hypothetical protein